MSVMALSCGALASQPPNMITPGILLPQTLPKISGTGVEATDLSAPPSDTWTIDSVPATVTLREYRLLLNGIIAFGPQVSPTFTLPAGTASQSYSHQIRVVVAQASPMFSAWTELGSGVVAHAPPQAIGTLANLSLTIGNPSRNIDLEPYFAGSDLVFSLQSGSLPSGSTLVGSRLNIAALQSYGPDTIMIRASNPGGVADQTLGLVITSAVTAPGAFQPGNWTLTAPASAGVIEIAVSALPSDGGSTITALEYRLNGGSFNRLGSSATGSYQITGLTGGQAYGVRLRAVNGVGAGPESDIKSVTANSTPISTFNLVSTAAAEIEVTEASGVITFTISSPPVFAAYDAGNGPGVVAMNTGDLTAGPVLLMPVRSEGGATTTVGSVLTGIPGLWVFDGDLSPPEITYRWLRDGVAIPGARSLSYTVQQADERSVITLEEIATGPNGTQSSVSAGVTVARNALLEDGFDAADGYGLNNNITVTSANWDRLSGEATIAATVNPLGIAQISGTSANENLRIIYAGAATNDHAIEVQVDSLNIANRADPTLIVRASGATLDGNCVRAFFRTSDSTLFFNEFLNGVTLQTFTIPAVGVTANDVLALQVSSTTATVLKNGDVIATMAGVTVTGGKPGWGAFLGSNALNRVSYRSALVENI